MEKTRIKRCVTLSYTDTLSTELAGSATPAAATQFVVSRLRMVRAGWLVRRVARYEITPVGLKVLELEPTG